MQFPDVHICAILSNDRINDGAVKTCAVINPIITKNSTNMNVRKLHNDKFDSKKAAKVGLDASLKASIVPDDAIIDLRNLVRDYYYFKDLQSAIVLKLHAELNLNLF